MVISDTRNINLTLPRSWNECTTEQLELISRIILEQIERVDRYHPFDMRNVKIACFFLFSGMEIVTGPYVSRPIEEQCYVCRFSSKPLGKRGRSWFRRREQRRKNGNNAPFPVYLWQINYWLSPKAKTDDRQSVEYKSAGAGLLDWLDGDSSFVLTRFPYPTLRRRRKGHWLRRRTEFMGVPTDMDGFSWQQYRFAADLMGQYTTLSNNLIRMKQMGKFTEEQLSQQAHNVNVARAMFLATIFNRRISFLDANTHLPVEDFHFDVRQTTANASFFLTFPDHQWQPILFWWTGMMQVLSRRFPHVFKVQKLSRKERPNTPLEIYTATIATMQKYTGLDEDKINNQSYSLVLEHLERLSKENEDLEQIRRR